MLPTDEARLYEIVTEALGQYVRQPDPKELAAWWIACRPYALADVQRALKSHEDDPDDCKRAPRPIDVKRRIKASAQEGEKCAASDATGRCEYPGIFSDGTGGDGPWYCPWHRLERAGPEASRFIEASRQVPFDVAQAKRKARIDAEASGAPGVVGRAMDIAKRHGNRPWQRGNIGDFLPANLRQPGADESEAA